MEITGTTVGIAGTGAIPQQSVLGRGLVVMFSVRPKEGERSVGKPSNSLRGQMEAHQYVVAMKGLRGLYPHSICPQSVPTALLPHAGSITCMSDMSRYVRASVLGREYRRNPLQTILLAEERQRKLIRL